MKTKRKEVEEVSDDFSLSSPPLKLRRLDVEPTLPPIMEVGETEPVQMSDWNEERAIVLFNPVNENLMLQSPSRFHVDPDFFAGFKSASLLSGQIIQLNNSTHLRTTEEEATNGSDSNRCMAVVPWVLSQLPITHDTSIPQTEISALMEADDVGEAAMDIEDSNVESIDVGSSYNFSGTSGSGDGLPQWWQQQHCTVQKLQQNTSTPVTWFH